MSVDLGTGYLEVKLQTDDSSTKEVESRFQRTAAKMSSIGKGLSIGLTAPLVLFGKSAMSAFEESEAVARVFAKTLDNVGLAGKINAESVGDDFSKLGERIGIQDEEITTLAGKIASAVDFKKFAGDATSNLEDITLTIENMSAQTGKSVNTYQKLFASLSNDPAAAIGPLTKLGVITKDQADKYKKMIDNGKGAVVQQDLLNATQKKFAGAARAASTPSERLAVSFDNFKEVIGKFILPLFQKLVGWLTKGFHMFENLSPATQQWVVRILALLAALGPTLLILSKLMTGGAKVVGMIVKFGGALKAVAGFINGQIIPLIVKLYTFLLANPFVLIAVAVVALAFIIYKNWDTIKKYLLIVWNAIKKAGMAVWNAIKKAAITVFNALKAPVIAYFKFYKAIFNGLKAVTLAVWNGIKAAAGAAWRFVTSIVRVQITLMLSIFNRVKQGFINGWNAVKKVGTGIWDAIKSAAGSVFNGIADLWNNTVGKLSFHVPDWVPKIGGSGFDVPDIPYVHLAEGGVVVAPTLAMLGEAGQRELVQPLPNGLDLSKPRQLIGTLTLTPQSRAYVEGIEDDDAGARARHARVLRRMGSAA